MTIENADRHIGNDWIVDADASDVGIVFDPRWHHPFRYHFGRVPWAVFGSVTFRACSRWYKTEWSAQNRRWDFSGVLHHTCSSLGLRGKNMGIYNCTEYGLADHCHLHFLVAQDGLKVSAEDFSRTFERYWTSEFRPLGSQRAGVGTAVVKPYDTVHFGDRGMAYCLKREYDDHGREQERYDGLSDKLKKIILQLGDTPVRVAA
jgi:hypothetical protein